MCNMHCDYCFYCDEAQKRLQKSYGFMSEETLKNVITDTIYRSAMHYRQTDICWTMNGAAF